MWKALLMSFILWLFISPAPTSAQPDKRPENLLLLLSRSEPDTNRIKILLDLGRYYLYKPLELQIDLDSALYYFQQAKNLSEASQLEKWKEECLFLISYCYFEGRAVQEGRKFFLQVIDKYQAVGLEEEEAAAWYRMGFYMHRNDSTYEEKAYYLQQSIELYTQLGEKEKPIRALKEIADIHLNQGELDQCEAELLSVVEKYKAIGYPNLHYTYDLLAAVYCLKGNLNRALYYGLEMIKSMETTGDSVSAEWFYYRMARIYDELEQHEKSVDWYKKSYAKGRQPDYSGCLNIVQGLIKTGKTDQALSFIQSILKKSPPVLNTEKAYAANALGLCYNALGKFDLAERFFLDMIYYEKLLKQQDTYTSSVNLDIGAFYIDRRRYQDAAPYLKNVLDIPNGIVTMNKMKDAHHLQFKVDSAAGHYLEAIHHLQRYKQLNDSLFNDTKSQQIEELQIQYETEKKEQDIKFLQNESQLQQVKLQKAGMIKNITFAGIALLLVVVCLLFSRYRMKQRANRQLEIHQIEINRTNQFLQNLLEEKEWLLKEIHHRVKNNLQIVMSLLNTQAMYLENEAALDAIRHSQYRLQSISLIHQKLYQSKNLQLIDMSAYIPELVAFLADSFNTEDRIRFELNIEAVEVDVTKALPIGLILNEAISNAIKYAFPGNRLGRITINMQPLEQSSILLTITDDGIGLPPDFNYLQRNSLGLNLMKGLSKQLGGSFAINNQNGLEIRITFEDNLTGKPMAKPTEINLPA